MPSLQNCGLIGLLSKNTNVLECSGKSPNLNPFENLWIILKNKVAEKKATSSIDLEKAIKELWVKEITAEYYRKLIKCMPKRINDVIKCNGGFTKY